ncbi:DUF1697 domain-containing protein [Candidatus Uabimicrobium amorphum]|uniref:DUF1697 domain-containing protein n=1 Tax=Uabimicrobium amorphum TaxID=2596890 RepID=A0A5S9IPU5_UABAM|nr:DUF1697 domain-containing protein [Candidatus Uabimicrobium amorphum]BBM85878.1 hypothetical protein UABAM_04260 [Candidatus Uabimicrobium amorphum]
MLYVALLRGINVGGKNKIDMKMLKKTFEKAGMESVQTYINTGNIVFSQTKRPQSQLATVLQKAIYEDFALKIPVLVRNIEEFTNVSKAIPEFWVNDKTMKCDVMFLWEDIDNISIIDKIEITANIDTVIYVPGAILWHSDRKNASQSARAKLAKSHLYQKITIRNVNTTRKIHTMLQQ